MRAFVLSGGGRLGPMQVGALRALLEHGVRPEMIVGSSVGALNAAYLARDISPSNLEDLAATWRSVSGQDIYPGGRVNSLWRLLRGYDSLHDNRRFYRFLAQRGMTPALTFGNCSENVRLFVTATHLSSGTLHVFGDDRNERVIDGLMASTALTPMHPPWTVDGERYVDGGTVTPLPIRVAVEAGRPRFMPCKSPSHSTARPEHNSYAALATCFRTQLAPCLRCRPSRICCLPSRASRSSFITSSSASTIRRSSWTTARLTA